MIADGVKLVEARAVTETTYYADGSVHTTIDAAGNTTTYEYDIHGRQIKVTAPDPDGTGPLAAPVTESEYNEAGQLVRSIDAGGNATTYTYDGAGRQLRVTQPDPDGTGPLVGPVTENVYNTAGQVTAVHQLADVAPYQLIARLSFDETSGQTAGDSSGQGEDNSGTLQGDAAFVTDSERGRVVSLDGTGDYISIADSSDINLGSHQKRTISVWFKADETTSRQIVYEEGGTLRGLNIYIDDGTLYVGGWSETSWDGNWISTETISPNRWHHVVLMLDGETSLIADALKAYLDGQLVGTAQGMALAEHAGNIGVGYMNEDTKFHDTGDEQGSGFGLDGRIDDFQIFNRVLTDQELVTLFNPRVTTSYAFDHLGRQIRVTQPDPDDGGPLAAPETEYTYDAAGQLISTTDARDAVTTYTYDRLGRQIAVTQPDPDGAGPLASPVSQTVYNVAGQVIRSIDPLGNVTRYQYDALGRQTKVTQPDPDGTGPLAAPETEYTYDAAGQLTSVTDALDGVTTYTYDHLGRQTHVTLPDPDGDGPLASPVTQTVYDAAGRVLQSIDPLGGVTQYEYDNLGRQSTITRPDPDDGTPTGPETTYTYNQAGQLAAVTDALGNATSYTYDSLGRQLTVTTPDPDGAGAQLAGTTTSRYDVAGRLIERIDPLDRATRYDYDRLGRLVTQTDALGGETSFTYDAAGNRLSLTDPESNTTEWTYDNLGRQTQETNQLDEARQFTYNAAGLLTRRVDRRGWVRQFTFDNLYRNTGEIWYDSTTDADADQNRQNTFSFTYDALGRMLTAGDAAADYTYTYDSLGRVTQIEQDITGLDPTVTLTAQYDAAGRRTQLAAQVGTTDDFQTDTTYDHLGRVATIKQQGQTGGNAVAEKYVDFLFDSLGRPDELDRYADLAGTDLVAETDFVFDHASRLTDITHAKGATTFADYDLVYDRAGQMTDFDFTSLIGDSGDADYTHDDTGQLTGSDYSADWQSDESYQYDDNGNRETANGDTYTTGPNNQLLFDGTYRYQYDEEGNRTLKFVDADSSGTLTAGDTDITEYTWDHRNRLTKVSHFATQTDYTGANPDQIVEYAYDFGQRWVRKVLDSNGDGAADENRIFVQDGNQIILDFQDTTTPTNGAEAADLTHRYLWGPGVDQLLADELVDDGTADDVRWALTDHLGSVRDLAQYDAGTDTTSIVKHVTYDAFGNVTADTASGAQSLFLYTARPFDVDTGLQNNLNRWYDALVGRWTSEDPVGFGGGDVNLYRYVGNASGLQIDPPGLNGGQTSFGVTDTPDKHHVSLERWGDAYIRGHKGFLLVVPDGLFSLVFTVDHEGFVAQPPSSVASETYITVQADYKPSEYSEGVDYKMAVVRKPQKQCIYDYGKQLGSLITKDGWMVHTAQYEALKTFLPARPPSVFPGDYFPPYNEASPFEGRLGHENQIAGNTRAAKDHDQYAWFFHQTTYETKTSDLVLNMLPGPRARTDEYILGVKCSPKVGGKGKWVGFIKFAVREVPTDAFWGVAGELMIYHKRAPRKATGLQHLVTDGVYWGASDMPSEFRSAVKAFNTTFNTAF